MPNLTFHIDARRMPSGASLAALTDDCVGLCTDVLAAERARVHVVFVAALLGHGHPVSAEIQYRLETFRGPETMQRFLDGMERAISRHTGLTARLRCFGHVPHHIHARN